MTDTHEMDDTEKLKFLFRTRLELPYTDENFDKSEEQSFLSPSVFGNYIRGDDIFLEKSMIDHELGKNILDFPWLHNLYDISNNPATTTTPLLAKAVAGNIAINMSGAEKYPDENSSGDDLSSNGHDGQWYIDDGWIDISNNVHGVSFHSGLVPIPLPYNADKELTSLYQKDGPQRRVQL